VDVFQLAFSEFCDFHCTSHPHSLPRRLGYDDVSEHALDGSVSESESIYPRLMIWPKPDPRRTPRSSVRTNGEN
jgi:hypothetical protein